MKTFYSFFILFFCVSITYHCQEPVSIHLSEEEGLPDYVIFSMIEDRDGFIWFAAEKGLFRYDGKSFKQYTNLQNKGKALFNLKIGPSGKIWCHNIAGQLFTIINDQLYLYDDYRKYSGGMLLDYMFFNDYLLIRRSNKILKVNLATKETVKIFDNASSSNAGFITNNTLYYFNNNFDLVNSKNGSITQLPINRNKPYKYYSHFFTIGKQNYIFLTDHTPFASDLYLLDSDKKGSILSLPPELRNSKIEEVTVIDDWVYFATTKGVFKTVFKNNKIFIIQNYLRKVRVTKVIQDRNKNIWVSTLNNGIYVIANEALLFHQSINNVSIIKKKNDSILYLGKQDGELYELNINKNKIAKHGIRNQSHIRAIDFNKKDNKLFLATDSKSFTYDEDTYASSIYLNKSAIKSINRIKDSTYLISQHIGTIIKTPQTEKAVTTVRSYGSIYEPISKEIYVSDIEGVKRFNTKGEKLNNITYKNAPIYGQFFQITTNGIVWLTTYKDGILGFKNGKIIENLNTSDGLASSTINCIESDGNNLWISTNKGLQHYNSVTKKFKILTSQDGINSYSIRDIEVLGNTVALLDRKGLYSFNKSKILRPKPIPKVYITNFSINGEQRNIRKYYELAFDENNIDIYFNTKNFRSLENVIYEYKLNDKKEWTSLKEGVDFIKLINLSSGNYNFQLRAKNKFTTNYSDVVKLDIEILAPFYKRWWFLTLVVLFLVGLIILYFRDKTKRLRSLQKKELEKEKMSKALIIYQLENLRSQMNPHFIFNSLNCIQDYIILNEKKLAREFLVKFSKLIRIYLEHSQEEFISLEKEIEALKLYLELEKARFNDSLSFEINIADTIQPSIIKVPSLFIQPYVENALKHGLLHKKKNKKLVVDFYLSENKDKLICVIDDNGIGRVASNEIKNRINYNKPFATKANQKRIDLINATNKDEIELEIIDKMDDKGKAIGTKVIIKIPIK